MTIEELRKLCLKLPGTTEQLQWGNDLLFKIGGKMYLVVCLDPPNEFSFKCTEEEFHELTEHEGIRPAPYLARARWVQVEPRACRLFRGELEALIRRSYELVLAKLPRRTQQALRQGSRRKTPRRAAKPRRR